MFNFLEMADNYESRKVAKFKEGDLIVSTAYASDHGGYETAVAHPRYNDSGFVIVEEYKDVESARVGHDKWVEVMTAPELPKSLRDVSSCGIAQMCDAGGDKWRVREKGGD